MRKVILFIAVSLDGYIADKHGGVMWLNGQNEKEDGTDTYAAFVKDIDTVVMGWNTYHQIVTELSPDNWVYEDFASYIITHRNMVSTDKIIFTEKNPCVLVKELQEREGKNIWICGGAEVIRQLLETDQIDEFHISVIPTILGEGIRLFGTVPGEIKLRLLSMQDCNGIVELIYTHR